MLIRIMIALLASLISTSNFAMQMACPPAGPSNASEFCSAFKLAAQCHCSASGVPKGMCMDMDRLYNRMISVFGSLQRACEFQHDTSTQTCIDDWNCYRHGGYNSQNQLCSGTGRACE